MKQVVFGATSNSTATKYISCSTCQNGLYITEQEHQAFLAAEPYSTIVLCQECTFSIGKALQGHHTDQDEMVQLLYELFAQSQELLDMHPKSASQQLHRFIQFQIWSAQVHTVCAKLSTLVAQVSKTLEEPAT